MIIMKKIKCEQCGEILKEKNIVWMELSITDGNYHKPENFPKDHESQGLFAFGSVCAKNVMKAITILIATFTLSCTGLKNIPERIGIVNLPESVIAVSQDTVVIEKETYSKMSGINTNFVTFKSIWVKCYVPIGDTVILKKIRRQDCLVYVVSHNR